MTRRFFIEAANLKGDRAIISGSDARHIQTVLRLKIGDEIELFDGAGTAYRARIMALLPKQVEAAMLGQFSSKTESPLHITVAQAFLKETKMDTLVRQLTELGITAWIPFISQRSVARPAKRRLDARKQRWRKIAQESLKQCRRSRTPQIGEVVSFEEVLAMGRPSELKVVFWENESKSIRALLESMEQGRQIRDVFLMLGPEGGFAAAEIQQAEACGFYSVSLGPRILKAETATLTACVLIQYLFGDLGQKNLDKGEGI